MNFRYCYEKNAQLLKSRGVGFEEIIHAIAEGNLLDIRKNHNSIQYPNQKILYVRIITEVYAVPYVEEEKDSIFLKTLFLSRKARKKFLNGEC